MKNIKVLHVANLEVGGVNTVILNLLSKPIADFNFYLFAPNFLSEDSKIILQNWAIPFHQALHKKNWESELAQYAIKNKIDIVHLHYPWRKAKVLLKKAGIRIILEHDHGSSWQLSPFRILKNNLKKSNDLVSGVIAVSNASKQMLINRVGYKPEKVTVIYNGFNFEQLKVTSAISRPEGKKIITTVSRLVPLKAVDLLIKTIPNVIKERTDVEFWIIGEGPLFQELTKLVNELGIANFVKFWGSQLNISNFLSATDLFVLTSIQEALGIVLIEAGFFEIPSIASNVDGISEVIVNGETGVLINQTTPIKIPKWQIKKEHLPYFVIDGETKQLRKPLNLSPTDLSHAILSLLDQPKFCTLMGQKAKERVLNMFNVESFRTNVINYYLSFLN